MSWLLVLGLKEGLLECATACFKSEVILTLVPKHKGSTCTHQTNPPLNRIHLCRILVGDGHSLLHTYYHSHTYYLDILGHVQIKLLKV